MLYLKMITEKDLKYLQIQTNPQINKGIIIFLSIIIVVSFLSGWGHLYMAKRICKKNNISLSDTYKLIDPSNLEQKYSGYEMYISLEFRKAINSLSIGGILLVILLFWIRQRRYNKLLIEYYQRYPDGNKEEKEI